MKKMKKVFGAALSSLLVLSMVLSGANMAFAADSNTQQGKKHPIQFGISFYGEIYEDGVTQYEVPDYMHLEKTYDEANYKNQTLKSYSGEWNHNTTVDESDPYKKAIPGTGYEEEAERVNKAIVANVNGKIPTLAEFLYNPRANDTKDLRKTAEYNACSGDADFLAKYTIRWYVLKESGNLWKMDGVLVRVETPQIQFGISYYGEIYEDGTTQYKIPDYMHLSAKDEAKYKDQTLAKYEGIWNHNTTSEVLTIDGKKITKAVEAAGYEAEAKRVNDDIVANVNGDVPTLAEFLNSHRSSDTKLLRQTAEYLSCGNDEVFLKKYTIRWYVLKYSGVLWKMDGVLVPVEEEETVPPIQFGISYYGEIHEDGTTQYKVPDYMHLEENYDIENYRYQALEKYEGIWNQYTKYDKDDPLYKAIPTDLKYEERAAKVNEEIIENVGKDVEGKIPTLEEFLKNPRATDTKDLRKTAEYLSCKDDDDFISKYTIRWYVLKKSGSLWKMDGVLVRKDAPEIQFGISYYGEIHEDGSTQYSVPDYMHISDILNQKYKYQPLKAYEDKYNKYTTYASDDNYHKAVPTDEEAYAKRAGELNEEIIENVIGDIPTLKEFLTDPRTSDRITLRKTAEYKSCNSNDEEFLATYTIRWYVLKDSENKWKMDGVLVKKNAQEEETPEVPVVTDEENVFFYNEGALVSKAKMNLTDKLVAPEEQTKSGDVNGDYIFEGWKARSNIASAAFKDFGGLTVGTFDKYMSDGKLIFDASYIEKADNGEPTINHLYFKGDSGTIIITVPHNTVLDPATVPLLENKEATDHTEIFVGWKLIETKVASLLEIFKAAKADTFNFDNLLVTRDMTFENVFVREEIQKESEQEPENEKKPADKGEAPYETEPTQAAPEATGEVLGEEFVNAGLEVSTNDQTAVLSSNATKTGDTTPIFVIAALLLMSAATFVVFGRKKKTEE